MERRLKWLKIAAVVSAVVLMGTYYLARAFGLFDLIQFWNETAEIPFNQVEGGRIAAQIAARRIVPDASGLVVLPTNLASATKLGKVYVTRRAGGLLLVLFPTWRGKGSNVAGYLFTSRLLTKPDTHAEFYTGTDEAIEVVGPQPGPRGKQAGPVEVTLEKTVTPQWYYVSYTLD